MSESDNLRAICEYLAIREKQGKLIYWRANNVPVFDKDRWRAMPKGSKLGVPDVNVVKDGFYIGLEVKTNKGKQSDNQKKFQELLEENGAEYHIVISIDDLKELGL